MINRAEMISFGIPFVSPRRMVGFGRASVAPDALNPTYVSVPILSCLPSTPISCPHNPIRISPRPSYTDWRRGESKSSISPFSSQSNPQSVFGVPGDFSLRAFLFLHS